MDQFASAFGDADAVVVPEIYSVRDSEEDKRAVSSADLVRRIRASGTKAFYAPTYRDAVDILVDEVGSSDVVITMGAGPVDEVAREFLQRAEASQT